MKKKKINYFLIQEIFLSLPPGLQPHVFFLFAFEKL